MNMYVCVKQVPDTEATIHIQGGTAINEAPIKWIMNPYDEFAMEESLRLKEKIPGSNVIALALGPERVQSVLRTALAMGADKAVHIQSGDYLDYRQTALALAQAIRRDASFGIIFMGKQAIDDDAYQVHILLAEELGIPVATNVTAFAYGDGAVTVGRDIDGGDKESIRMAVPCVVAAAKGLNTPRYASVIGIMKAKKIEIAKLQLSDLGVSAAGNKMTLQRLTLPPEKLQGKIIPGEPAAAVHELVRLLKEEAKVL